MNLFPTFNHTFNNPFVPSTNSFLLSNPLFPTPNIFAPSQPTPALEKKTISASQKTLNNLAGGALAGGIECLVFYPLDLIKTRFQLATGTNPSIATAAREILQERGFKSLYRGIISPLLMEVPKRSTKFGLKEAYSNFFKDENGNIASWQIGVSGGLAGSTEFFIVLPFENVKIAMQNKANNALYNNSWDCAKALFRNEGFGGFFKTFEALIWRNFVWNFIYFGFGHSMRTNVLDKPKTESGDMFQTFCLGFVGATMATFANVPFDVVKSRQAQSAEWLKLWTLQGVSKVYSEEGLRALWKGFAPKVARLAPGGGLLLVISRFVAGKLENYQTS